MYSTRSLWQRVVLPKLVCLLAVFLLALTSAAGAQTSLRLDADKDKNQPRSWRLMTDAWHREFSGAALSLSLHYEGDAQNRYTLTNSQDKTHFLCSLSADAEFAKGWQIAGDAALQKGSHDRDLSASITLRRVW